MKKNVFPYLLVLFLILLLQPCNADYSQDRQPINDSIYSDILKEQRSVKVLLPETYKPGSGEKYEVIYLTDGEWAMDLFSFLYKFAKNENYVPPVILVAVQNKYIDKANQRDRDFLPVKVPEPAISGGADKFISFLKNELIPYVDKTYPANGTNSLYGHSYGGLFVMYVLLTAPDLFGSYYSTDPSFWWNDGYMIKLASEKLANLPAGKLLWIAGIDETYKNMGIYRMDSVLRLKAPAGLNWKLATFPNEKHNSVKLKAMYDGMKFSYSGYSATPLTFHPMNGILLKDKPTTIYVENYPEVRYTTDGTDPGRSSKKAESRFLISGPAQLVVKSFSVSGKYDKTTKGSFVLGEALPSVSKPKKIKQGGVKYSYYEGSWENLPDFKKLAPLKSGVADSTFSLNGLPSKTNYACLFEGYYEIPEDGYYAFAVVSKGGSKFLIGDKLILDNDGVHATETVKSFLLPLKKGFHPIRLEFFQKDGNNNFQFLYLDPKSDNPRNFPFKLQYN